MDAEDRSSIRTAAKLENLAVIRAFIRVTAARRGAGLDEINELVIAVDEAVTNIMMHGYQGRTGMIEISVESQGENLVVRLRDQAPSFDPTRVPPPDLLAPLEERQEGGLGVHLVRQSVSEMAYRALPSGGNELVLIKQL